MEAERRLQKYFPYYFESDSTVLVSKLMLDVDFNSGFELSKAVLRERQESLVWDFKLMVPL